MFDAEDLKDEGFNLEAMTAIAEQAMAGIYGKSKEAKWLENHLGYIRDQCEYHQAPTDGE